jgi:hypothetical protein
VFQRVGEMLHLVNRMQAPAPLQGELLQESVQELAAELYAFFFAMVYAEASPVPQTISAISETANGSLIKGSVIYEAVLFAALNVIVRARLQYTEPQLRQLVDDLSFEFSLYMCDPVNATDTDDSEARRCKIRAEYDRALVYRYEHQYRNLRARWLCIRGLLSDRIAGVLLRESFLSKREFWLFAWLKYQLNEQNISVPTSVLDSFARAIVAETDKITSAFFSKSSTESQVSMTARQLRKELVAAMDMVIPDYQHLNRVASSYTKRAEALNKRQKASANK